MKSRDLVLLSLLRQNARESLVNLSKTSKIPVSTIYEKLRNEFQNYVSRYTALLCPDKIGFGVHVFLLLKISKNEKDAIEHMFKSSLYVNSVYRINNNFDFIIELLAPTIKEVNSFVDNLNRNFNVVDVLIFYVSKEVMHESFLTNYELVKLNLERFL